MNAACVKKSLVDQIHDLAAQPEIYCQNPGRDFTRKRKLPFCTLICFILNIHGGSLTNEVIDYFCCEGSSVSSSAVVQMRDKLKADVFKDLLIGFNSRMEAVSPARTENGLRILAVDGTEIQTPTNPDDVDSYYPGANGQRPYNMIHMNALYDLLQRTYLDAVVQKSKKQHEHKALIEMIETSPVQNTLLIADRGYESYNTLAHIHERGWFYLVRIKDGKNGIVSALDLPDADEFDLDISMNLTRSFTNATRELFKDRNHYRFVPINVNFDYLPRLNGNRGSVPVFYNLKYRIVRIRISEDLLETLVTNLPADQYPPDKLKELYSLRWGIETSFRSLKYTVGMLSFNSKKAECILQEVLASLVIYNFTEWITAQVIIRKAGSKHTYKINFTAAVHLCRKLLAGKMHPPDVEALIAKYTVPVRPNRKYERRLSKRRNGVAINFTYRIA
ncbi:MAG: IS4 family transposase [Oscillospiraceae bacterium]|nr:IS4 family transposase [Oscillospiraceae bacterium]